MKFREIGEEFGMTQQWAHIIVINAVRKLFKTYKEWYKTTDQETFSDLVIGLDIIDDAQWFLKCLTIEQRNNIIKDFK